MVKRLGFGMSGFASGFRLVNLGLRSELKIAATHSESRSFDLKQSFGFSRRSQALCRGLSWVLAQVTVNSAYAF